ncbi:MAG TPA: DNA-formamidopyrimidine glycosylase family protein [Dehalococcoidia bacterium]|jgi:formamidopyrimidine-DNA glycosylase|nr:DNA-formamidopyrimidine glycosylase family protein [Dehalococcoidia bacterium]
MPEIPDLEAIRAFLNERIVGVEITQAETYIPYIFRTPAKDVAAGLTGNHFGEVLRRGKFLLFTMADEYVLVINPMLTGRFQYLKPSAKKRAKTCLVLTLENGWQLRYADERLMGKIYYMYVDDVPRIPQFDEMGPDALEISEEEFRARIRRHSGAIKNILTNHKFVAGIGNAYADEILFEARINPFRKRPSLSDKEIGALYAAIGTTLRRSLPVLREHFREELDYEEWRDHLKIHRKGSVDEGRCPRCGTHITEISPNQRITSYCRNCQV